MMGSLLEQREKKINDDHYESSDLLFILSRVWCHCRDSMHPTSVGRCSYPRNNSPYRNARNSNSGSVSASRGLKWEMTSCHRECPIFCLHSELRSQQFLGTTSLSGQSNTEVRPSRITPLRTISLELAYLSRTCKKTTYVRPNPKPFLLEAYCKRRTPGSTR